jgi:IS5 family transposase
MLRIYFLQQWFNLSDPQAEDAIYDSESMRRFAGVELSEDVVPDESTILRFRHLLEEHHLTAAICAAVRDLLAEKHLLLQAGHDRRRHDHRRPELDQGLVHGAGRAIFGDRAYWSEGLRQAFRRRGVRFRVQRRAAPKIPLSARWQAINHTRERVRARGESPFLVVKRLWGFAKVRYRGLTKNTTRAFAVFALANLYMVRHRLLPAGATCRL